MPDRTISDCRSAPETAALIKNFAAKGQKARHRSRDRALTGPIGADERDDLPAFDFKINGAHRNNCAVSDFKTAEFEHPYSLRAANSGALKGCNLSG
jgi:hypothetical protein